MRHRTASFFVRPSFIRRSSDQLAVERQYAALDTPDEGTWATNTGTIRSYLALIDSQETTIKRLETELAKSSSPQPKASDTRPGVANRDEDRASSQMHLLQRRAFDECETAQWDPLKQNTFGEEIGHLHEEVSEAFRAYRRYHDYEIHYPNEDGKPEGIPIEFADVLIGMFYNAELHGFDLFEAMEIKHHYNLQRNYQHEGRALHGIRCTGLTAIWCPVCGDCTCDRRRDGERDVLADDSCPLHSLRSKHGEPPK